MVLSRTSTAPTLRRRQVESGTCEAPACLPDDPEPERVLRPGEGAT